RPWRRWTAHCAARTLGRSIEAVSRGPSRQGKRRRDDPCPPTHGLLPPTALARHPANLARRQPGMSPVSQAPSSIEHAVRCTRHTVRLSAPAVVRLVRPEHRHCSATARRGRPRMTNDLAEDATDHNQGAPAGPAQAEKPEHPQQQEMPLAMVHGQPVLQIPQDLYIPPDALEVILDAFEGPLDLLLYLIRRQNLEILDIPVAEITRQYVDYIQAMHMMRFELAAEYLVMAAILAEIKSRMLLPRAATEEGDEADPRAELVRRLQEY